MRGRSTAACLALAVAAAGGHALAQSPEGEIEVVVRGDAAGAFTSRASVDDSARPPIDAGSLLAELPGVHLRRLGGEGSFAALSVRGSASTQVGVYLAGIPLTSAGDPSVDAGALPLWPGASFRVHRGFAPAALGTTGYLGGVVSIDPPSVDQGERTAWWAGAGSFGSLKIRIGDTRRVGDLSLATGLSASRSDGDFSYEVADPPISGPLRERTRANAGHVSAGGIERASVDLSWGSVGALVFADARRQGLPGSDQHTTSLASLETSRVVAGVDATARTGERGAMRSLVWARRERSALADPLGELGLGTGAGAEQAIEAVGGSIGWRGRPVDALTFGGAIDARGERFRPEGGATAISAGRLAGGIGADAEWRVGAAGEGAWPITLSASARLDARRDRAEGVAAADAASGDLAPSGHVGASIALSPAAVISAHAGALRRPPGFVELYGDRGALLGDPSLTPERALSVDAGVHGDTGDAGFHLSYEVVGFATAARDLITFVPIGLGTFRAQNLDPATLLGAEVAVALAARGARSSLSYTLVSARNTGDDPLKRGEPLPDRPAHDLAYDASWRFGPVSLRYALDAIAETTLDEGGTTVLPPRFLHGAGAAIDVPGARGLRAAIDVENLLDARTTYSRTPLSDRPVAKPVSDFLGFPLPGRAIWVTLRWRSPAE